MPRFLWGILWGVWSMVATVTADDARDLFEARTFHDSTKTTLLYRQLLPPRFEPTKKYPLVIFLHGAGERGSDNVAQLKHGMADFASEAIREQYPAIVIAPQCPSGEKWVNVEWSAQDHAMPEKPAATMHALRELIDHLASEFAIDPDRIYITGLSMGGFGTWDAVQRYPDLFAAAAPICGGGDPRRVDQIKQVPIWAFHGERDTIVKPERTREMIAALKAAGAEPKYTEYPGVAHDSWSATYRDPQFYAWLFAQRRRAR
jgi:predicted peptidase